MIKILVVEDDVRLNKVVCDFLTNAGFLCVGVFNGNEAIDTLEKEKCDLIISDIMMPLMDGFELCKNIRMFDKDIPILLMTARDDILSKQKGYSLGVDDYIVKPFELDELSLRVGALLRRAKINASKVIEVGDFKMNEEERTAKVGSCEIALSVREFDILFKMLSFPGKTFTRSNLMDMFWDFDSSATSRTVDVYMSKLREKISDVKEIEISTVHGLGYRLVMKNE